MHLRYRFSENFDDYPGFQPKVTPKKISAGIVADRMVTELIQKGHSPVKEWSQNGHRTVRDSHRTITADSHRTVTEQNCCRTHTELKAIIFGIQKISVPVVVPNLR